MSKTAASILAFINRNEREQEVPEGFVYVNDWIKKIGCTKRTWGRILAGLERANLVEMTKVRRVKDGQVRSLHYYKIDKSFLKQMGIK